MANGERGRDGDDGGAGTGLPKHTTPTWEVELLISGVAVFAMLQLPGLLDDAIFEIRPRFSDWGSILDIIYMYAKSAAVMLAATFVLHLVLRARWIALVGMHSIYPDGILWDKLRLGPYTRQAEQRRLGEIPDAIERADNRATTVFAVGVSLALMFVILTLIVAAVLAASLALGMRPSVELFGIVVGAGVVPYAVLQLVDREWGERLRPDGLAAAMLRRALAAYAAVGFGNARSAIFAMLASHGGRSRVLLATTTLMLAAIFAVGAGYFVMRSGDTLGNYAQFPASADVRPPSIEASHYADRRDAIRDGDAPYLPSMVVRGPYLEVTVPYQPVLDEAAMREACPGATAIVDEKDRMDARLACLARIHALRLDGKPLAAGFETGSDAATGRPALVAMVDIRALAPGRHELRTARLGAREGEPQDHVIPFWR